MSDFLVHALDLVDDMSPTLWAALFVGVFALLLVSVVREDRRRDREEDQP